MSAAEPRQILSRRLEPILRAAAIVLPAAANTAIDWNFSWNVSINRYNLAKASASRRAVCALTCLTCHDPHEPAGTTHVADYNRRCLSCHPKSAANQPTASIATCRGSRPNHPCASAIIGLAFIAAGAS